MGLFNFFNHIGGSRIKEITPQERCKWLENPRPVTATGLRFTKRNISNPVLSDASSGVKTTITADDKSSIFKGRSRGISLPKVKSEKGWRRRKSLSGIKPDPEQGVPDLPVLSRDQVFPVLEEDKKDEEELTRPGTAITTDDKGQNEIFELPAESIVPTPVEEPPAVQPTNSSRKRSKSSVSDKRRSKRATWFLPGRQRTFHDLPPLPTNEPERPSTAGAIPSTRRKSSVPDTFPQIPTTPGMRDSLGAASILRSFPSVPSLKHDTPHTSAADLASPIPRDSAVVTSPPRKNPPPNLDKPLPTAKSFSQPLSPMLAPDSWPRPPSNSASETRSTKRRSSAKLPPSRPDSDEGFLSQEVQKEYNRVTRFLESMGSDKRSSGVVRVVSGGDHLVALPKYSNQEALAALEFEIGGEVEVK